MAGVRGQGRKFDVQIALDRAMDVFWRNGYEGTSIAELTLAMGITTSSLYAAFKNKRNLFDLVVQHYLSTEGRFMETAFNEEVHALPLVHRLLFEAAEEYADKNGPGGCLIASAAACVTDANRDVEKKLKEYRLSNIKRIEDAFRSDVKKGIVAPDSDAEGLAGFVGAVLQGMAQLGRDGASATSLRSTAEMTYSHVRAVTRSPMPTA